MFFMFTLTFISSNRIELMIVMVVVVVVLYVCGVGFPEEMVQGSWRSDKLPW